MESTSKNLSVGIGRILVRVFLPILLLLAVFVYVTNGVLLPSIESNILKQKQQMIKELGNAIWHSMSHYHDLEKKGELKPEEARKQAAALIKSIYYGEEQKDYFWINDLVPRMIMHPHRPELDGTDLSKLQDPNGNYVFVEFAKIASESGEGYSDYFWQWKDDPTKIVPKRSYVRLFKPWGWVIGTGIYLEDVEQEIADIKRAVDRVVIAAIALSVLLAGIIAFVSVRAELKRQRAERDLRSTNENLTASNQQLAAAEQQLRANNIDLIQKQKDLAEAHEREKRQQEQLIQADKMASLGSLVAGVAHEINNPNQFIMLSVDNLMDLCHDLMPVLQKYCQEKGLEQVGCTNVDEIESEYKEIVGHIHNGTLRIKEIVSSLKDFARKEETSESTSDVDLNSVCKESVLLTGSELKKTTRAVCVDLAEDIPLITGRRQRIEQVVINLINNACHAISSPDQKLSISTEHDKSGGNVIIRISDEGCGIDEEAMRQIKDPFFTTKRDEGGTGLGLSISTKIIEEEHGGRLEIESEVGKGTTVSIILPVEGGVEENSEE